MAGDRDCMCMRVCLCCGGGQGSDGVQSEEGGRGRKEGRKGARERNRYKQQCRGTRARAPLQALRCAAPSPSVVTPSGQKVQSSLPTVGL